MSQIDVVAGIANKLISRKKLYWSYRDLEAHHLERGEQELAAKCAKDADRFAHEIAALLECLHLATRHANVYWLHFHEQQANS